MKLVGKHIYIRLYKTADANELANLHIRNREFFSTSLPVAPRSFFIQKNIKKIRLEQALKRQLKGKYTLLESFLRENDKLIGDISLTQIVRGDLQSCYTGFTLDKEHNAKGYTTEDLQLVVDFCF